MNLPKNMLIYYGWLNSFNSAQNAWTNEKVAQELARYSILVLGDGIQLSSHGDYANTGVIIPRIKALNPDCLIFGYASINQSYADFKTKANAWNSIGVHGIFMDEYGYDYGSVATNGRSAVNDKIDYTHGLSSANLCFANAWKIQHVLGENSDASFPDSTWNPDGVGPNLNSDDWYLLESFAITSAPAYESAAQWKLRGEAAKEYGINVAACSVILDTDSLGQDKFDFIYTSACMFNLEAVGSSDASYGAGSAKSKMWARPAIAVGDLCEPISICADGSKYLKYFEYGLMKLDFTAANEDSGITVY